MCDGAGATKSIPDAAATEHEIRREEIVESVARALASCASSASSTPVRSAAARWAVSHDRAFLQAIGMEREIRL